MLPRSGTMLGALHLLPLLCSGVLGFRPCPDRCLCYEASDLVDCRSRELSLVPHHVPHGTWLLDLSGNKLTEVRKNSFTGLWSLRILLLSNNSIQALKSQSLSSLRFLEILDLSFNQLRWLSPDFSQSLSSLQELRLDHNLLQDLTPPSLDRLENLRKLDLSRNRISRMGAGVFNGLGRLRLLNLEENRLDRLRGNLLTRQRSLEVLLLGQNNISGIESEALAPLRSLTLLGLRGNRLERVRFRVFQSLPAAGTYLQMSRNPWLCDCDLHRVFGKIRRVRRLHLEDRQDLVCHGPPQLAGAPVDGQLCVAETAAALAVSVTAALAVMGALVEALRRGRDSRTGGGRRTST